MLISDALDVNEQGHLTIGGCDVIELTKKYGTPLYVLDETLIRSNCREYKDALDKCYNSNGMVCYASKAFVSKKICKIIESEGLGLDVVSGGELYTAIKANFPADRIYMHGNYKSDEEIKMAIEYGIRSIVIDSESDLNRVNRVAIQMNKVVNVSLRLKPGIEAHTHEFIMTGGQDSKFGIDIESGEALALIHKLLEMDGVNLTGIHCHIGSQIFDYKPFEATSIVMLEFIKKVKDETGCVIEELNLGGGYGIKYLEEHNPVPFGSYLEAIAVKVKEYCDENGMNVPFILMEPGRSIIAPAGITLYTAQVIKDIPNVRKYVIVDGSMADSPRYSLYGAEYECVVGTSPLAKKEQLVTIAGRICESGDIIIKDCMMPDVKEGDVLAVLSTGAYNYSMSSNYNRLPRPAVILTKNGESEVIVKAETYEDIIRNDN